MWCFHVILEHEITVWYQTFTDHCCFVWSKNKFDLTKCPTKRVKRGCCCCFHFARGARDLVVAWSKVWKLKSKVSISPQFLSSSLLVIFLCAKVVFSKLQSELRRVVIFKVEQSLVGEVESASDVKQSVTSHFMNSYIYPSLENIGWQNWESFLQSQRKLFFFGLYSTWVKDFTFYQICQRGGTCNIQKNKFLSD